MNFSRLLITRSKFRRSETIEQHEYEKQIYEQQQNESQDNVRTDFDKMGLSENNRKKNGVFKRLKDHVKASFPEAIQDVKIMSSMTALETKIKKDISDASLYPEVNEIAEVRRGLDLCPEEKTFLEKRE